MKEGRKDVETHLFVGVDAVDDNVQELASLGLELVRLGRRGRGGRGEGAAVVLRYQGMGRRQGGQGGRRVEESRGRTPRHAVMLLRGADQQATAQRAAPAQHGGRGYACVQWLCV